MNSFSEKTMKDRSKNMFMKALTAASESSSSVQVQMEDEEQIEKRVGRASTFFYRQFTICR